MKLQELDKNKIPFDDEVVDEERPPKKEEKRPKVGSVITYRRKSRPIDESTIEEEKNLRQFKKTRWD